MDIHRFEKASGQLVPIDGGEHGFVPASLPANWEMPLKLWPLLAEARQQIGILEGIGRNLPNPGILLRPLADREAIRSSRLEGTYATAKELLLFELQPQEAKSESDPANDHREVFNYRQALDQGTASNLPLSLRLIRQLHRTLLSGVRGRDKSPGDFRKVQVAIGAMHRFVPPPPQRVSECLDALEKYFHSPSPQIDPLVDCFLVHYQFEAVHPFMDGNGRVGRLLLAIMLQNRCRLTKPWLYMSEFYERNRDEYVDRLFEVSTISNWDGWIEFCLRGTVAQAKDAILRCERLLEIQKGFRTKLADAGGSVRLHLIVEDIFISPFVRIADLPKRLEITYPTAKADVDRLVEAGILQEMAGVFPKTYYAPEVFNVAYDKMES